MKKRVLSLLLALAMCLSLSVPAWAVIPPEDAIHVADEYVESVIHIGNTSMIARDYNNGDVEFLHRENGTVLYSTYVDRENSVLRSYKYTYGKAVLTKTTSFSPPTIAPSGIVTNYGHIGTIGYQYYVQGYVAGTNNVALSCSSTVYTEQRMPLNGSHDDWTDLAGGIASALGLPGYITNKVVQWVVGLLGLVLSAKPLVITNTIPLRCTETALHWETSCGTAEGFLYGSRFDCIYNGSNMTETEDTYWPVSSFSNRNIQFARAVQNCTPAYWGTDGIVNIVSWS